MIRAFTGGIGEGKTKEMVRKAFDAYMDGYYVEANINLRFPSRDGWQVCKLKHIDDYVDKTTGRVKQHLDNTLWCVQEIYSELSGRLFGTALNRGAQFIVANSGKEDSSVFWDSQRFEDPDIVVRTVTNYETWCFEGDTEWIALTQDCVTGELAEERAPKDVVRLIGQFYNTKERARQL